LGARQKKVKPAALADAAGFLVARLAREKGEQKREHRALRRKLAYGNLSFAQMICKDAAQPRVVANT
jgi:hypothetical protein